MKKNNIMNKIIKPFAILSCLLAFASCEVGLGPKVDVIAPTVTVNKPENTGFILGTFTIDGTASDDTGVSELTILIEPLDNPTASNSYKFRMKNQKWEVYNSSSNSWSTYDTTKSSVKGDVKALTWSLTYTFGNSVENGTEFMITTQVFDDAQNESKNSKDERSVTIDNVDPAVSLITPATVKEYSEIQAAYNSYTLNDNSVLTNLLNGELLINGSQKEDGKLEKLIVYLDEKTTRDTTDYNQGYLVKKEITGENLRNWEASFKLYELQGFEHDKKILRLVTESHDQAGNIQILCHGWFIYWNDADIPWVVSGFGGNPGPDNDIYENATVVYPSCGLQGQAYDDDGIESITIKVYKNDETNPVSTQVINLASESYPKYKAWSVNALGTNCNFNVECWCKDIKGNVSQVVRKYMSVKDINPPEIFINTDTTQVMLGDANGKVTISGYVTDDGGISSLKLVRIKAGTNSNTIINYYSSDYSEWNKASANGTADANGNKIWELPLSPNVSTESGIVKKTFTKDFNIFTDFGINGDTEKLNTQNFIIMALDEAKSDTDKACAKIDSFTWAGDTHAPELEIKKLYVNEVEKIDFPTFNAQKKSKMLKPFERNTDGTIKDKIKLTGTWSDNSTDNWTVKTRHSPMTVEWEGATVTVTFNDNGTWTTNSITPPDVTTAIIAMSFRDWAGNIAKANENFFISSNDPELLRITTTENDGSFSANDGNKTIHVILEFNKAVTFAYKDNTQNPPKPTLTLNVPATGTKRTITYSSGNGTTQHVFDYEVHAGENTSALEVTAINANDNTWKSIVNDTEFPVKNMSSFNDDAKKLSASRTIIVDTTAPTIKNITPITSSGSFNKDKEIFIQLEFNEEVTIEDISKLKINLNSGSGTAVTSNSAIKTGPKTVLFIYKVGDNHNASPLTVSSVTYSGAGIKDIAKNALATGFASTALTGIIVDTTKPNAPSVTNITDGQYIYSSNGATVNFSWPADAVDKKYSINNGVDWQDYSSAVQIKTNGSYTVTAKAIDAAGNESDNAVSKTITVDIGNFITSVSAELPTGTYTTNKVIPIVLNLRKEVKVAAGSTLTVQLSSTKTKTATIKTEDVNTLKDKLVYEYTVADGDSSDGLNVTAITGTFTDAKGTNVSDYIIGKIPTGKNLLNNRTIKIITGKPVVNSVSYNKTTDVLTITFSREIRKGSGNITLEHGTGYKAPSVISEEKFANYIIKSASLANYYTLGTNGSDINGNSDLTEKYVLNYDTETNNTTLISALKDADADKFIVSVNNSNVTVEGTQLKITFSDSFAVPVKGASYNIYIDANVVKDKQNHGNEECDVGDNLSINYPGLEAPVVRVNKKRETIGTTVTQPTQTGVKAECQTPGATVTCVVYRQQVAKDTIDDKDTKSKKRDLNLTENSTQTTYPFNIGATDTNNGYIYRINATAKKTGETDVPAYEFAYRSVFTLTSVPNGNVGGDNDYKQLWVRGSDLPNGGVSISSYPVSWDTADFDKVRAMTNTSGTDWVWISWEINKAAHLQPLRGNMPSDAATKGPDVWCWGMQSYVPGIPKGLTPLYPGHSLAINADSNFYFGAMSFYEKHCEYRDGNKVVKEMK